MNDRSKSKFKELFPYFLLAVAIIIAYKIITEINFFSTIGASVWSAVAPFIYGLILAYIISIPSGFFERLLLKKAKLKFFRDKRKVFSILAAYIITGFVIFLIINLLIPIIYDSISQFIASFPTYYKNFLEFIDYINSLNIFDTPIQIDTTGFSIQKFLQSISQYFGTGDITSTVSAVLGISSVIFDGFLTFISSIYVLYEKDKIKKYLSRMLDIFMPTKTRYNITTYAAKLNANLKRYLFTQSVDSLIIGTIATIELTIMGSPYALNLGILLGVLNFIPYFGAIVGCIIAIVIVGFSQGLIMMGIAAAALIITQQIDGNIIQPKLMGYSFSISPLLLLFAIVLGGTLGGVIGMIAAIPITAVLKDLIEHLAEHYKRKHPDKLDDVPDS